MPAHTTVLLKKALRLDNYPKVITSIPINLNGHNGIGLGLILPITVEFTPMK